MKSFENMTNGALCSSDMKQTKYKLLYAGLVLYIAIYFMIVLIPVLWMVLTGFKDASELAGINQPFFPKEIRLSKIWEVWKGLKVYDYYLNTFILAAGCVVFDVVINGLAGYVLSCLRPRGNKLYFGLVTCLMLLPTTISMVPLYMTFTEFPIFGFKMLDTWWPMWLLAGAKMFHILLFKTSFDSISLSLIEAAKIDGASAMHIFFKIVIPLSVPVITTVSLFTFNEQFGNFFWPYLTISDNKKMVLGVRLYLLKAKDSAVTEDWKMLMTLFSILPQLIVFALFQKKIIGGINIGGVKG